MRLPSPAAALLVTVLSACASVPRGPDAGPVDAAQLRQFDLAGRVNIRLEKEALPGRIRWQHRLDTDEVLVSSPLGISVARLRQDATGALVVTSDGKEYRASDLNALSRKVLGWDFPLDGLQYWVRGLPWPGLGVTEESRDEFGRLQQLVQEGWRISYLDWTREGAGALPSRLDLRGDNLRMRLIIDQWNLDVAGD